MSVIKEDLVIPQGTAYSKTFSVKDSNGDLMNLSGYTANSQMRREFTSNTVTLSFTTAVDTGGYVTISTTPAQTSPIEARRYLYDVEINDGSDNITRIREGIITLTPEITK